MANWLVIIVLVLINLIISKSVFALRYYDYIISLRYCSIILLQFFFTCVLLVINVIHGIK